MTTKTQAVLKTALDLSPHERAELIDCLYNSLDSEKDIDALWAQEAEERVHALDAGLLNTVPADEVFKRLEERYTPT